MSTPTNIATLKVYKTPATTNVETTEDSVQHQEPKVTSEPQEPLVDTTEFDSLIQAATSWYQFGFAVIPLIPGTKQTAVKWDSWLENLSSEKIIEYWSRNPTHELGFIVGDNILVLDADSPESLAKIHEIENAFGVTSNFIVKTTKGEHHYFRRAAGTFAKSDSHDTKQHPNRIDFKTGRSMVVLPPSTGKEIEICDAVNTDDLLEVGQDFIDAIFRHNGRPAPRPQESVVVPTVSPENHKKLALLLDKLAADLGYDDWLRVAMAIFYETGGSDDGFALFNSWSSKGTQYKGVNEIRTKWQSFKLDSANPITIATIYKMLSDRGIDWIGDDDEFKICSDVSIGQQKPAAEIPTQIEADLFPHKPRSGSNTVPTTIENLRFLLAYYGIIVRYNVITKKLIIHIPKCYGGTVDNADNVGMSRIISLANLCGMSSGQVAEFILVIADENQVNPVADWINSKLWDGQDRLQALYNTLETKVEFPKKLKETLMFRWMLSLTAAALMPRGFKCRGVLTLQGFQSMGKGSWIEALVSDLFLREQVVLTGKHLDTANKDDVVTTISHWIVELGELDSSFKKDIARLKGFLTNAMDKVRRPYARTDSEYQRRTVFVATVNDQNFLVDPTGNTRFWTLPLVDLNYQHNIDMQQVFAQLAVEFAKGEQWWLTREEEQLLEQYNNENHRVVSAIRDRVLSCIDLDKVGKEHLPAMSATELLLKIGILNPTNGQARECGAALREILGDPKKIQGNYKWRIRLKDAEAITSVPSLSD